MNVTAKKVQGSENEWYLLDESGTPVGKIEKVQDFTPTKLQGNVALAWKKRTYFAVSGVARQILGTSSIYRSSAKAAAEFFTLYTK